MHEQFSPPPLTPIHNHCVASFACQNTVSRRFSDGLQARALVVAIWPVPQGRTTIAQRFIAGSADPSAQSPAGTKEVSLAPAAIGRGFCRPCGTLLLLPSTPSDESLGYSLPPYGLAEQVFHRKQRGTELDSALHGQSATCLASSSGGPSQKTAACKTPIRTGFPAHPCFLRGGMEVRLMVVEVRPVASSVRGHP